MKYLLILIGLCSFLLLGCEKEQNRKLLDAYFKYTVSGTESVIKDGAGLNNNVFDLTIKKDTVLIVNVSKQYEGVGFYVKSDSIRNGTYVLDNVNRAYYTNPKDNKRYYTTNLHKGSLTIEKDTFQAKSVINIVRGNFMFSGIDTITGKTLTLTNGSFLMERKD